MILRNFISLRAFTVYMENSLRFEIWTEVSFTTPEVMWTLITKLLHTEVKFYPEVKSQTGLLYFTYFFYFIKHAVLILRPPPWKS